jgi:hypothetical protein
MEGSKYGKKKTDANAMGGTRGFVGKNRVDTGRI